MLSTGDQVEEAMGNIKVGGDPSRHTMVGWALTTSACAGVCDNGGEVVKDPRVSQVRLH